MKWSKLGIVAVLLILSVSYLYSSFADRKLSATVRENKLKACTEQNPYPCDLIDRYHEECFENSYVSRYKMKAFDSSEYDKCIETKFKNHD